RSCALSTCALFQCLAVDEIEVAPIDRKDETHEVDGDGACDEDGNEHPKQLGTGVYVKAVLPTKPHAEGSDETGQGAEGKNTHQCDTVYLEYFQVGDHLLALIRLDEDRVGLLHHFMKLLGG